MNKNMLENIVTEDIDVCKFNLLTLFKSEVFTDIENNLITKLINPDLIEQDWIKQVVKLYITEPTFKEGSKDNFLGTIYKISQSQNISLKFIYMKRKYDNENVYYIKTYPHYHYTNGKFKSHNTKLINGIKSHEIILEFKNLVPLYE